MSDALLHRGPDGDGYWEASPDERGWGAMLAHRRLSILDLSPAGAQPMVDPVSGDVLVLNGEIYNYVALRDRLAGAGHKFQSSGDTAVMLRSLSVEGRQAVCGFRGMFAFAYWNTRERKLVVARDPLGIKPLYVARCSDPEREWSLIFASEVRAILASGLLGKPRLNPSAAASVAWNGFVVTPGTAVLGIEAIWPGQIQVFDGLGKQELVEDYWSVPQDQDATAIDELELGSVLDECVRAHLVSDVPLAVFLSAGVDSASVANLAQKNSSRPVNTFTLAFEEQEYNEGIAARRVAEAIGTQHQEVMLTEQQFISQLEAALDSLDQPTFDGINSYYISHAVRQAGLKVALVGTGGDELFGGYSSFRELPELFQWSRRTKWIPNGILRQLATLIASVMQPSGGAFPQQTRWAKLPEMVRRGDNLLSLYQLAYSLFLPDFQRELLGSSVADALPDGLPPAMRSRLLVEMEGRSPLPAISVMEQRLYLGERLLQDADCTSMASSIEMRLPFVDQLLFEYVLRLPDRMRYYPVGKKAVLRRLGLRGLDPALFERPKTGFVMPYDRWFRRGVGKVMDRMMRDPAAIKPTGLNPEAVRRLWQAFLDGVPGLYCSRVWAIYVYVRWCHRYGIYL